MERRFTGLDEADLNQQIWAWRAENPTKRIATTHPMEWLPLAMMPGKFGHKITTPDRVMIRIEYETKK